jgi:hypothetical protein
VEGLVDLRVNEHGLQEGDASLGVAEIDILLRASGLAAKIRCDSSRLGRAQRDAEGYAVERAKPESKEQQSKTTEFSMVRKLLTPGTSSPALATALSLGRLQRRYLRTQNAGSVQQG